MSFSTKRVELTPSEIIDNNKPFSHIMPLCGP